MTVLHANWLAAAGAAQLEGTISDFHVPIWEFVREHSNRSCKVGNPGAAGFLRGELSCPVLIWQHFVYSFVISYTFRISFVKMHVRYVEHLVSLKHHLCDHATACMVNLCHSGVQGGSIYFCKYAGTSRVESLTQLAASVWVVSILSLAVETSLAYSEFLCFLTVFIMHYFIVIFRIFLNFSQVKTWLLYQWETLL